VKEPDSLDAVLLAKQIDRRHDKSRSVWTLARDVVATVDTTKVASSVFSLNEMVQRLEYASRLLQRIFVLK
jgi:hypothetical protein